MRRLVLWTAIACCLGTVAASAAEFKIVPDASKIEFVGTKVNGSHTGGFKTFSGKIAMPGDDFSQATINLDITTDSMYTDDEKLTKHLKNPDFFEVRTYPKASFASKSIAASKKAGMTHDITGDLTLHGVTKTVTVPVKVTADANGATLAGTFVLQREDFKISYGKGMIGNDVKVTLSIKAAK